MTKPRPLTLADITDHHDGFGLAEALNIYKDAPGPGGASHLYEVAYEHPGSADPDGPEPPSEEPVARIQFQRGPRDEPGSTPGVIGTVLIAVLLDQLRAFQASEFSCRENAIAITKLEEANHWLQARARGRKKRGVLGTIKV